MWRQFLAEPWCHARSAMVPTGINTWTHQRPHLSDQERADDLTYWRAQAATEAFRDSLWRLIAQRFASESVNFELEVFRNAAAFEAERSVLAASLAEMKNSTSWRVTRPLRQLRLAAARLSGR
jgi:hypothetical protein